MNWRYVLSFFMHLVWFNLPDNSVNFLGPFRDELTEVDSIPFRYNEGSSVEAFFICKHDPDKCVSVPLMFLASKVLRFSDKSLVCGKHDQLEVICSAVTHALFSLEGCCFYQIKSVVSPTHFWSLCSLRSDFFWFLSRLLALHYINEETRKLKQQQLHGSLKVHMMAQKAPL